MNDKEKIEHLEKTLVCRETEIMNMRKGFESDIEMLIKRKERLGKGILRIIEMLGE